MKKSTKKKGNSIEVNFNGVSAEGGSRLLPEGPVLLEVIDITQQFGADSGQPYLSVEMEAIEDELKGSKVWGILSLAPAALWKLRGFLENIGMETQDSVMNIDLDEIVGQVVVGHIAHEEYKGKTRNRVVGYSPVDEAEDPKDNDKSVQPKKSAKSEKEEADEGGISLGKKVSFKDGRKKLTGKVMGIDGSTITVEVDGEEYEMDVDELIS